MTIASKLRDKAAWGEERYARFAKLLQYCLSGYFKTGLNMCSAVVGGLTKVLYKVRTVHAWTCRSACLQVCEYACLHQ